MERDVDRVVKWIREGAYERVGVQCPDHLLPEAPQFLAHISKKSDALLFILADTSFQTCCVDEVAAQHYGADAIIHIGDSCQSLPGVIPTIFVFDRRQPETFNVPATASYRGVLICDTEFHHCEREMLEKLGMRYVARPMIETVEVSRRRTRRKYPWYIVSPLWQLLLSRKPPTVCGRNIYCDDELTGLPNDPIFIYVGEPHSPLERRLLLRWGDVAEIYRQGTRLESDDLLAKRYGAVEAVRRCELFGLVLGVAAVEGVTAVCTRLERMLEKKGKKSVRLLLGKLSVSKLGNVPEIDCFVLISCPHHEALSARDYPKPIVCPFDVEVACEAREWSTEYKLDIAELLDDSIDWSSFDDEDALPTDIVSWQAGLIENRLRTWGGLESEPSKEPALVIKGQHGIASRYDKET